ncbi:MAG: hypothetical protein NTW86_01695 [Candidatus Sumerlaeota bacterium]|nr:hypothetical protein [Candidatus Sumerlaeota bacterium]
MNDSALESFLREYVRGQLLEPRGLGVAEFRLVEPETGVKTFVRLVEIPGQAGYAARVYPRRERRRAVRRLQLEKLLLQNDLSAPRLVNWRLGSIWRGPSIVVEELLRGRHLAPGEWTAPLAERLAATLLRFHAVSSPRHGPIEKPSSGAFFDSQWSKVRHRLRGVRRRAGGRVPRRALAEAARWFRSWRPQFAGMDSFDLIHDKLNSGNVLWLQAEERFALLDFETLQYGSRVKDWAQAEHDVLTENEAAVQAFRAASTANLPPPTRQFCESVAPFFHAYYHLSEAATALKRSRRATRLAAVDGNLIKLERHWAEVERIMGES